MQLRKPIFHTLLNPQSLDSQPFLLSAPTHLHNHKPHLPTISLSFHKPTTPKSTTSRSCIPSEEDKESKEGHFSSSGSCNSLIKSKMMAIDPYVVWTFFASLLGFLLLSVLRRRNYGNATAKDMGKVKNKNNTSENHISEECVTSPGDGECRPEYGSGTDVIIVGAGVAGSALAHTLGKVIKK